MFKDADDGLLARLIWAWPESKQFRLGRALPDAQFAIDALDRLRLLDMTPGTPDRPAAPICVPLASGALAMLEAFAQDMQAQQKNAAGLLNSAYGKARGLVVRLSLNLEMLRWAAKLGYTPAPTSISEAAFESACNLVANYFMPMAARVYGDAATPEVERNAATLARWIIQVKPREVHVRDLQRKVRLSGLSTADAIKVACAALVDADWLRQPEAGSGFQARGKVAYPVNPAILGGRAA